MMEKKVHYKMHKVKKNWVAIAVTSLALLVAPKALGLNRLSWKQKNSLLAKKLIKLVRQLIQLLRNRRHNRIKKPKLQELTPDRN